MLWATVNSVKIELGWYLTIWVELVRQWNIMPSPCRNYNKEPNKRKCGLELYGRRLQSSKNWTGLFLIQLVDLVGLIGTPLEKMDARLIWMELRRIGVYTTGTYDDMLQWFTCKSSSGHRLCGCERENCWYAWQNRLEGIRGETVYVKVLGCVWRETILKWWKCVNKIKWTYK